MTYRPDLDEAITRAAGGDDNAHTAVLTRILQLRWMGFDGDAAHLSARLARALHSRERHHREVRLFDEGDQRTSEPSHSQST